jgi:hypothetical protein
MTSLVHSIRRRTLVACLAVASLAGASGALASLETGSDYASPEVLQLGFGPGGPPSTGISTFVGLPEDPVVPAAPVVPRCDAWEDAAYMPCE